MEIAAFEDVHCGVEHDGSGDRLPALEKPCEAFVLRPTAFRPAFV